jgi:exodeoxyribonuclease III
VASVYVPHGRAVDHWHYEFKVGFLEALAEQVRQWLLENAHLLVAGDLNVAATDHARWSGNSAGTNSLLPEGVLDLLAGLL